MLFPAERRIAKLAALVSVLHLGFVLYAGMLATETFFVLFFLLFLICFLPAVTFRWWWRLSEPARKEHVFKEHVFIAGLSLGVASMIRPVGHYLIVIACVLLLSSTRSMRGKITRLLLLGGGWLLVAGPWLVRNVMVCGALFFHTLPGLHFLQ